MRAVVTVRRELGVRTLFNILGPLTNPALARRQVLGVFAPHLVPVVAEVLLALGAEHAMVVHSDDGLDEISVSAPTTVAEVRDGRVRRYVVTPEDLGLRRYPGDLIGGGDAQTNAAIIESILAGEAGAGSDVVAANAGAALYVAGIAPTIRDGVTLAQESIRGGAAMRKLADLVRVSQEVGKAA
jgi:anthranilate phosphoribosyltransferase